MSSLLNCHLYIGTDAESKEKPGVWDPMPELTVTLPYNVYSRVDSNTFTMPDSTLTLCQSRLYPPVKT